MSLDDLSFRFSRKLARIKAGQVTKKYRSLEVEDVEQRLIMEVLIRWPRYDPLRGTPEAFVEEVIRGQVCKIMRSERRRRARLRRLRGVLIASVREDDPRDPIRCLSLRMDVPCVVGTLPAHLIEACHHLANETRSVAAGAAGMSRNGLAGAIKRSRPHFRKHSLDLYL
jgi:hypothetical protein